MGWLGSVHDARVFSNSQLYALGCSERLFPPDVKEEILGKEINPVILADPAYPMLNWLLKGYPENVTPPLILATNILKTMKLKSCIPLFISAAEDSRRHTQCFK